MKEHELEAATDRQMGGGKIIKQHHKSKFCTKIALAVRAMHGLKVSFGAV